MSTKDLIERLERKLEIRNKWKGTVHEWKKKKNTEIGNGLLTDTITALREKDARIAELTRLLEHMCYHFDDHMNNVDCGPWYDIRQDARKALQENGSRSEGVV